MRDFFIDFDRFEVPVPGAVIRGRRAGQGRPVVLLHGYPQTGAMWCPIAPALSEVYTVIVPDLRGYGQSTTSQDDFTFRAMAADIAALMSDLGFPRFDVVGHDRGARVTHRLALDHPERVESVALLDILPTVDVWDLMDALTARRYFHWGFLSQPGGMPQTLINAEPLAFLEYTLGALGAADGMDPRALQEYRDAAQRPEVVHAWCADYRDAATVDPEHDRADIGRTLPHRALVLWGERGLVGAQVDPLARWARWFPSVVGQSIAAGHFLVEERPEEVRRRLEAHLGTGDRP